MLYFFFFIAVLLVPLGIRFWASTEKDAIIIQAEFMLPFKSGIKFLKKSITAKKVIASLFSSKKAKKHNIKKPSPKSVMAFLYKSFPSLGCFFSAKKFNQ
mgnify:CR=1 FL=1